MSSVGHPVGLLGPSARKRQRLDVEATALPSPGDSHEAANSTCTLRRSHSTESTLQYSSVAAAPGLQQQAQPAAAAAYEDCGCSTEVCSVLTSSAHAHPGGAAAVSLKRPRGEDTSTVKRSGSALDLASAALLAGGYGSWQCQPGQGINAHAAVQAPTASYFSYSLLPPVAVAAPPQQYSFAAQLPLQSSVASAPYSARAMLATSTSYSTYTATTTLQTANTWSIYRPLTGSTCQPQAFVVSTTASGCSCSPNGLCGACARYQPPATSAAYALSGYVSAATTLDAGAAPSLQSVPSRNDGAACGASYAYDIYNTTGGGGCSVPGCSLPHSAAPADLSGLLLHRRQQALELVAAQQQRLAQQQLASAQAQARSLLQLQLDVQLRWACGGLGGGFDSVLQFAIRDFSLASHTTCLLSRHMWARLDGAVQALPFAALVPRGAPMLVCVWIACKLEENRKGLASAARLGQQLGLSPRDILGIELNLMQLLSWQPYQGCGALMPEDALL